MSNFVVFSLLKSPFCLQLKTHLHPETGARVSLLPFRLPHEPVYEPDVSWSPPNVNAMPWWQDETYNVGLETAKAVKVRVMNPLIKRCAAMRVRNKHELKK